ncbi:MAG: molybdate ABC transporter substrate-binding protein [Thermoanaerobaculia bacterium]
MRLIQATLALLLVHGLTLPGARPVVAEEPVEIRLYAAASLRDVLRELEPALERATGTSVALNLGASSDLARQIVAANKADVYFSADEAWMDHVVAAGLVDEPSRRSPLSNRLVVVVPTDSGLEIRSAADLAAPAVRRLSLAHPETVPAGKYAKAWLESRGQWAAVAERVVPALDVRAALAAVESGAVEAGVVYGTDAAISDRVRVAYAVPERDGPKISYAIAALVDRPHLDVARAVAAWLAGPEAAPVFERFGFVPRATTP